MSRIGIVVCSFGALVACSGSPPTTGDGSDLPADATEAATSDSGAPVADASTVCPHVGGYGTQEASCSVCPTDNQCTSYVRLEGKKCFYPCSTDDDCVLTPACRGTARADLYKCKTNPDLVTYAGKYCQVAR
jgi:hypothetical protein